MLTILADENIANLDEYFGKHDVNIIKLKGRDINQSALNRHQPDALLVRSVTPINPHTITDFGKVRFIGSATIGTDHIDQEYLADSHIAFANASGCSKHSVAQYVISAILTLRPSYLIHDKKIQLGIIGLGNIGSTLASYATDLGWQVLGCDPFLPKSAINNCSFDELLANSDIISIHTPLSKNGKHPTYQLFNKSKLLKLKDNTLLINSARGEIINQDDLMWAIYAKNLQVVLDVFPKEPSIDKSLLDLLTIATPHIAGYTLEGKIRGTDMIYQAFCQVFNLPILQDLAPLLPPNPLSWQDYQTQIRTNFPKTLSQFYDICQDDADLRKNCDLNGVNPNNFDKLRKNYPLRREWIF